MSRFGTAFFATTESREVSENTVVSDTLEQESSPPFLTCREFLEHWMGRKEFYLQASVSKQYSQFYSHFQKPISKVSRLMLERKRCSPEIQFGQIPVSVSNDEGLHTTEAADSDTAQLGPWIIDNLISMTWHGVQRLDSWESLSRSF